MATQSQGFIMRICVGWLMINLPVAAGFVQIQAPSRSAQTSVMGRDYINARMSKDDNMTPAEREIALSKATKAMTAFTNTYLKNTGTKLCADKSVPAVVITGLAEHKVTLGAPLCPCRFYDDKEAEAKDGYWNCPCVPMRERHECHCMLFLTDDNAFVGEETSISLDEVAEGNQGMQF